MEQEPVQKRSQSTENSALDSSSGGVSMSPPAFQLKASADGGAGGGGGGGDLVSGFAKTTGHDLSDVKVNMNSDKPAQVGALAYAQGNEVNIASGQEKHLPHELAHVVQQREGRVKANTEVNGMPVNDNVGLESEADRMGDAAKDAVA